MENDKRPQKPKRPHGSNNTAWGVLASVKLTIGLLIFLAFVSIIGTIIPQNASEAAYLRHYGPQAYAALRTLGFLDIYHSWWFNCLLALLSLNLLTCSARNIPRTWRIIRRADLTPDDTRLKSLPCVVSIRRKASPEEAKDLLITRVRKFLGSPVETADGETLHLFAEKAKYSRLGVYVTHASVIIILAGGLIGSLFGFKGNVTIVEGERASQIVVFQKGMSFKQLGFDIRCDDFEVTYYPNGAPKDYKSTLTIIESGNEVLTKVIEVNHPLRYKGLTFYQSSYGTAADQGSIRIAVKGKNDDAPAEVFTVEPGGSFVISKAGLTVKANRFFSDFFIDNQGTPANQSPTLNNPALELLVFKGDDLQYRTWIFQKFPDFHGNREGEYQFIFKGFIGKEYTGLQVTKDPGVKVVWTGCVLMILGIVYTFFVSHRQVWVRITPDKGAVRLLLAGTANKNRLGFKKDFDRFSAEVESHWGT